MIWSHLVLLYPIWLMVAMGTAHDVMVLLSMVAMGTVQLYASVSMTIVLLCEWLLWSPLSHCSCYAFPGYC